MTETEVRGLVAEVLCLRNTDAYADEEQRLIADGAVLNSQVGRADIRERAARLRSLTAEPLLLQSDLESGSYFAADGTAMPPQMALGAAADEGLACDWGRAIGLEGRRLGVDVTWSPVLDVNTNPDNPIVNVRAFGEDPVQVGRLGAAVTRGFLAAGMHPCGKHWPGHGDVAMDSHISLPTVTALPAHGDRLARAPGSRGLAPVRRLPRSRPGERDDRAPAAARRGPRALRHGQPHSHRRDRSEESATFSSPRPCAGGSATRASSSRTPWAWRACG